MFMDRISRHSKGVVRFEFSGLRIFSLFADDVILLAPSGGDPQLSLVQFTAKCEVVGMRISTSKCETMVLNWKWVECLLQVGSEVFLKWRSSNILGSCS